MTDLADLLGATETDQIIRCKHDRMAPDLQIGDQLFVRPQKTAEPGQIVVVETEEGWTFGYYPGVGKDNVIGRVIGVYRVIP